MAGWNTKKLKKGKSLQFEDGSSVSKTKSGKLLKFRANNKLRRA